jgi:hypothetical protein
LTTPVDERLTFGDDEMLAQRNSSDWQRWLFGPTICKEQRLMAVLLVLIPITCLGKWDPQRDPEDARTYYERGKLWYYDPVWNPSPLFRIVDNRLSAFWRIGLYSVGVTKDTVPIIAFEEWVNKPWCSDQLTDGGRGCRRGFPKVQAVNG